MRIADLGVTCFKPLQCFLAGIRIQAQHNRIHKTCPSATAAGRSRWRPWSRAAFSKNAVTTLSWSGPRQKDNTPEQETIFAFSIKNRALNRLDSPARAKRKAALSACLNRRTFVWLIADCYR